MTRATTSYSGFATICLQDARLDPRASHGSIQYGFVTDRFKKLRNGQVTISGAHQRMGAGATASVCLLRLAGEPFHRSSDTAEQMEPLGVRSL